MNGTVSVGENEYLLALLAEATALLWMLIVIRQAAKIAILVPSLAGSGTLVSNKNIKINEL